MNMNKKILAIAILFAIVVGAIGTLYAQDRGVVLRSTQTFVGGGATLTLNSGGTFTLTMPPNRVGGRYNIDTNGRFIIFTGENGVQQTHRFAWVQGQVGQIISWIDIDGTIMNNNRR
jgi:hypothetical protein